MTADTLCRTIGKRTTRVAPARKPAPATVLNDVHSKLNACRPRAVWQPRSLEELQRCVQLARANGWPIIASGSRHAMGGQQFREHGVVLDLRGLNRVRNFDAENGVIEVEAGLEWPELIAWLQARPEGAGWGIVQKQTGADRLTIGGAVSANIHGRGLTLRPFVQDIEQLTVVDANGRAMVCSRTENPRLFQLVVGGYGLFGVIYAVRLRLTRRHQLRRVVELVRAPELMDAFAARIAAGFTYGDWQFAIDSTSPDFLNLGVFSCYEPVEREEPMPAEQRALSESDWNRLLELAHVDKKRGFEEYAAYYLATSGQRYWSDLHQMSAYVPDYHRQIDCRTGACAAGSEMITELFVPRHLLATFLADARERLRACEANVIYGTVRLIEREEETYLAWAREPWACIIFNLHVDHEPEGIARAQEAFRTLIDGALECGGSYYLTYHRWATKAQVVRAYPKFAGFLAEKKRVDPAGVFQSAWYGHYAGEFGGGKQ